MTDDFYGVYLLYSLNEKFHGRIYIGFTVNPSRRITQHNKGSRYGGAKRTSNKGPWEMALIICGFPNDISALRFEWAWQNPLQSRRLNSLSKRKAKESLLNYHLRLLDGMLSSPPWNRLPLAIHCLNPEIISNIEDVLISKPVHMEILQGPFCHPPAVPQEEGLTSTCQLCYNELLEIKIVKCYIENCAFAAHVTCLANHFLNESHNILPILAPCPSCDSTLIWGKLMKWGSKEMILN